MEEIRKLQITGGSTYIISLPKKWVRSMGLQAGKAVRMTILENGSLIIRPYEGIEAREKELRAEIHVGKGDSFEKIARELITRYIVGYNVITVYFERGMSSQKDKLKSFVRDKLIGVELLEESATHLQLQCLVKYDELPLIKAVERMGAITQFMIEDAIRALLELDRDLAEEVIKRDDEVDRFYLFTVRQLKYLSLIHI